jgi:hypothetical protein
MPATSTTTQEATMKKQTRITIASPTAQTARRAALMNSTYRALRNPRIVQVDVVGLSGSVSYLWQLTIEHDA